MRRLVCIASMFLGSCVAYEQQPERWEDEIKVKSVSLPQHCAPFYNDGTGRWAECMGVGPK
jgi:hypothetical protein